MTRLFSIFTTDERILERLRAGDEEALNYLYDRYIRMIRKMVLSNNGSDDDADDILQDTLINFWEKVRKNTYEHRSRISTYLYAVARNMWLQEIARRSRTDQLNPGHLRHHRTGDDIEDNIQEEELTDLVKTCMNRLSPICREILTLFYYHGHSMEEISRLTGLANEDTAKSKKYQCKKELEKLVRSSLGE